MALDFNELFATYRSSAWRLEVRDTYKIPGDEKRIAEFMRTGRAPRKTRENNGWIRTIEDARALAGLVLVDSSHEAQNYRPAPYRENRPHYLRLAAWKLLRPLGLIRTAQDLGLRARPAGPVAAMAETARQGRADAQELLGHALTGPGATPPDLGDLPLLVITAGSRGDDYGGTWQELQAELAASSSCSTHILAAHAGHHVHRDDPGLVVQAMRDMIAKLRP